MYLSDLKGVSIVNCLCCGRSSKKIVVEYGFPLIRGYLGQCENCGIIYDSRYVDCPCNGEVKKDEEVFCFYCKSTNVEGQEL